jgi:acetyltransferase-like isoleucine patch superfamily enzyme
LAPEVFITASDYAFERGRPFREQPKTERDVVIGDDVWLGVRVVVTAGVTIGDGCIVGAASVVTRDLPPNSIAVGAPARVIGERPPAQAAAAM